MSDNGMMAETDTFTEDDRNSLRDLNKARGEHGHTIEDVTTVDDGVIVKSHERREVFSFDGPGIGAFRFDVRGIKDSIVRGDIPACMFRVEVPESFYQHVLEHNGVEPDRLPKLKPDDLERPGIMVAWPNGYQTMIDGNHRMCARYMRGLKSFRFLVVDVLDCSPHMCRPGDEQKLFRREKPGLTLLHSEIKIDDEAGR